LKLNGHRLWFARGVSAPLFLGSIFFNQGPLNETRPSSSIDAELAALSKRPGMLICLSTRKDSSLFARPEELSESETPKLSFKLTTVRYVPACVCHGARPRRLGLAASLPGGPLPAPFGVTVTRSLRHRGYRPWLHLPWAMHTGCTRPAGSSRRASGTPPPVACAHSLPW
jgi:hypothetical protein